MLFTTAASAGTVLVGSNASTPDQVELLSGTGIVQGVIGPHNASAAAVDSNGNTFFAIPDDFSSTVWEYDPTQNLLGSFVFTPPSDSRDSAGYIEDMTWGPGGWLWISTFSGEIYALSSTGALQGSFDTGASSPGVTTDGTYLYTTEGAGFFNPASHFYRRDTSGNVLDTVDTGLNDTLGIGFDSQSGTFWIGGFDVVSRVDASGNVLEQFAVDGVHTGLEVVARLHGIARDTGTGDSRLHGIGTGSALFPQPEKGRTKFDLLPGGRDLRKFAGRRRHHTGNRRRCPPGRNPSAPPSPSRLLQPIPMPGRSVTVFASDRRRNLLDRARLRTQRDPRLDARRYRRPV